jgi:hypothetical protein
VPFIHPAPRPSTECSTHNPQGCERGVRGVVHANRYCGFKRGTMTRWRGDRWQTDLRGCELQLQGCREQLVPGLQEWGGCVARCGEETLVDRSVETACHTPICSEWKWMTRGRTAALLSEPCLVTSLPALAAPVIAPMILAWNCCSVSPPAFFSSALSATQAHLFDTAREPSFLASTSAVFLAFGFLSYFSLVLVTHTILLTHNNSTYVWGIVW